MHTRLKPSAINFCALKFRVARWYSNTESTLSQDALRFDGRSFFTRLSPHFTLVVICPLTWLVLLIERVRFANQHRPPQLPPTCVSSSVCFRLFPSIHLHSSMTIAGSAIIDDLLTYYCMLVQHFSPTSRERQGRPTCRYQTLGRTRSAWRARSFAVLLIDASIYLNLSCTQIPSSPNNPLSSVAARLSRICYACLRDIRRRVYHL